MWLFSALNLRMLSWNGKKTSSCSMLTPACLEISPIFFFLQSCYCAAGFRLQSSAASCVDIDECNAMPHAVCKHTCLNTRGSYVCHCRPDFYLEPDNTSCKTRGTVGLHCLSLDVGALLNIQMF